VSAAVIGPTTPIPELQLPLISCSINCNALDAIRAQDMVIRTGSISLGECGASVPTPALNSAAEREHRLRDNDGVLGFGETRRTEHILCKGIC